jgi:ABC-type sugar transport system ATPase subunit
MMPEILLSVEGVSKKVGRKEILSDINLSVERGAMLSLLGPPGAGKTTLLKIITGLDRPSKGRIYIDGVDVTEMPAYKRPVAMVFQSFALFPNMSVYENIAHPLRRLRLSENEIRRRVIELAETLGIQETLARKPNELSGGQMQRVAIARALAKDAKLYLLDEPFTNLDAKVRETLRVELKKLYDKLGITVILATPDPLETLVMGGKVAVMRAGKILQVDEVLKVYEEPLNAFVAEYLSYPPMNMIKGFVSKNNEEMVIKTSLFTLPCPEKLKEFEELIIGIRPDTVRLDEKGDLKFNCEVIITEVIGSDTIIHVSLGAEESGTFKIFIPGKIVRYDIGTKLRCSVDYRNIYVFNAENREYIGRFDKLI